MRAMSDRGHQDITRRSFEGQVGLFARRDSPFARRAGALAWIEPLDADMLVLDVACGAGHVAEQIAPHVRQVIGIDLTRTLLNAGSARMRDAGVGNVLLQDGEVTRLPFVDESFDLVCCRTALHHFTDPAAAVAEMRRVCRPGGRVALADMVAPSAAVRERFDAVHRDLDPSHVRVLLEPELHTLLEQEVGPLVYADTPPPMAIPFAAIVTPVADRDAVTNALQAEIDGGDATGFSPAVADGELSVSFCFASAQAERR